MKREITEFIRKHNLFHSGATVLVGVSGGPDSMALLHFLNSIKKDWGFRIVALAIDHGLRGEQSKQDVQYVKSICHQWEIEFFETFLDVPSYKVSEGKGTQLAARELRYQFFEGKMKEYGADYLALAHHGDDQVETMIMRFIKNSNPSALKGIPVKRKIANGYLVRPFLCLTKPEIEAYCNQNGIMPRRDPSNNETVYTRNFLRHQVVPLLAEKNPNLYTTVQRLSELLTVDDDYLKTEAVKIFNGCIHYDNEKKEIGFTIDQFTSFPFALQRRVYHLILNYLYDVVPNGLNYVHEDQFFELIHNDRSNVTIDFPMHLKVSKSYQQMRLYFHQSLSESFVKRLDVPGIITLPNGSSISATFTTDKQENSIHKMCFPVHSKLMLPLVIRNRKPGDKMQLKGLNGRKKVKDIFIDEKVPLDQRDTWPIVEDQQGNIIWLIGLKNGATTSGEFLGYYLQLHYHKGNE